MAARGSEPFVGREDALAAVREAYGRARSGQCALVLVGGEAGIGKTRLVAEFAAGVRGEARVLGGACLELGDQAPSYAPFIAVLRHLLREDGTAQVAALAASGAAELAWLLPEFGAPHPGGSLRSLLSALDRAEGATRVRPRRLSHGEVSAQMAGLLGEEPEAALAGEARETAARAGLTLERDAAPAPHPADRLGLTARQREVLRLVALGRTNRDVAQELYISVKTASVHVSHILAKLRAVNRGEAAAIAHRAGLAEP